MERLFTFFQTYRVGVLLFLLTLAGVALLVQWFAWIFGVGRFRPDSDGTRRHSSLSFIASEAIIRVINDFGHVIALMILFIFSFTLIFVLYQTRGNAAGMTDALKTVVSTMGGLVGAVIGYYFNRQQHHEEPPRPTDPPPPPAPPAD